jgi:hypothetical protein
VLGESKMGVFVALKSSARNSNLLSSLNGNCFWMLRSAVENHPMRLVVDTGSPDVMLFESRMSDSAGLQTLGTQETVNASGSLRLRKV